MESVADARDAQIEAERRWEYTWRVICHGEEIVGHESYARMAYEAISATEKEGHEPVLQRRVIGPWENVEPADGGRPSEEGKVEG